LKIDEQGLTALVQKFSREKIGKEEKKQQREEIANEQRVADEQQEAVIDLLFKDEMNEQAVVRALIEFGNQPYEDTLDVANYIFSEIEKDGLEDLFDNKLLVSIINEYKHSTLEWRQA